MSEHKDEKKQLLVLLPKRLKDEIRQAARKDNLSMSGFVRYHISRAASETLQASD